jgi:hypothetical protein
MISNFLDRRKVSSKKANQKINNHPKHEDFCKFDSELLHIKFDYVQFLDKPKNINNL